METLNPRAGFLSNYEVLHHLRQQSASRQSQLKALAEKKRERCYKLRRKPFAREGEDEEMERIQPEALHTVTFETMKYLEEPIHPIRRQSSQSITTLLDELEKLDLTKAERLQIVNLAPTNLVALVVCVEEFEERFPSPSQHDHILSLVAAHLSATLSTPKILPIKPLHPEKELDVQGEMEEDERVYQAGEDGEDDDLVQEGLEGEGEKEGRELDEGDA